MYQHDQYGMLISATYQKNQSCRRGKVSKQYEG